MSLSAVFGDIEASASARVDEKRNLRTEDERRKRELGDELLLPEKRRMKKRRMASFGDEERIAVFHSKMWEKLKISRRIEKSSSFTIDALGLADARAWSQLFGAQLPDEIMSFNNEKCKHVQRKKLWKLNFNSLRELVLVFGRFYFRCEGSQTCCVLLDLGVKDEPISPLKIAMHYSVIRGWSDTTKETHSRFWLKVTFRTIYFNASQALVDEYSASTFIPFFFF